MKTLTLIRSLTGFVLALALVNSAYAGYRQQQPEQVARVIDARPIYQRVAYQVPQETCRYEVVSNYQSPRTSTLVGGLIGASIGQDLSYGRRHEGVATLTGGLIGAAIGHDLSRKQRRERQHYREQVCYTSYRTEYSQELVGYDVTYKHQGVIYHTQTSRHPGSRIAIDYRARPSYARR